MPLPVKALPQILFGKLEMYIEHLLKQNSTYHQNLFAQNRKPKN